MTAAAIASTPTDTPTPRAPWGASGTTKLTTGTAVTGVIVTVLSAATALVNGGDPAVIITGLITGLSTIGLALVARVSHTNLSRKALLAWQGQQRRAPAAAADLADIAAGAGQAAAATLTPGLVSLEDQIGTVLAKHDGLPSAVAAELGHVLDNFSGKVTAAAQAGQTLDVPALLGLVRNELSTVVAPDLLDRALANARAAATTPTAIPPAPPAAAQDSPAPAQAQTTPESQPVTDVIATAPAAAPAAVAV